MPSGLGQNDAQSQPVVCRHPAGSSSILLPPPTAAHLAGASQAELQAEAAAARNLLASLDVSPSQPSPGMATAGPRGSTARAEASAAVAGAAAEAYAGPQLDVHTVQQQLLQLQYQQAQYMQAAGLAQLQGAPLVQVTLSARLACRSTAMQACKAS